MRSFTITLFSVPLSKRWSRLNILTTFRSPTPPGVVAASCLSPFLTTRSHAYLRWIIYPYSSCSDGRTPVVFRVRKKSGHTTTQSFPVGFLDDCPLSGILKKLSKPLDISLFYFFSFGSSRSNWSSTSCTSTSSTANLSIQKVTDFFSCRFVPFSSLRFLVSFLLFFLWADGERETMGEISWVE